MQHKVSVDRATNLVLVQVSGFFTAEGVGTAGEAVREAIRGLGDAAGKHVTLYDFSDVQIAASDAIDAFKAALANPAYQNLRARRIAFVTRSALATLQIKRMRAVREDLEIFEDKPAAIRWLRAA
jgi:hypothetical protein